MRRRVLPKEANMHPKLTQNTQAMKIKNQTRVANDVTSLHVSVVMSPPKEEFMLM